MVNAAIAAFTAVIADNRIFEFFTVHADFLNWGNQKYNCSGNASSATAMVGTGEIIMQFGILIFQDAQKIKLLDALKVNKCLKALKLSPLVVNITI